MTFSRIISLLILSFLCSCKQGEIIGNWRRVKPNFQDQVIKISKDFGDMKIKSDSTFYVQGDSLNQTSSIPGWHLSGDYYGSWEYPRKGYLILRPATEQNIFPYSYKIIRLTKKELVLLLSLNGKRNKHNVIRYLRQ